MLNGFTSVAMVAFMRQQGMSLEAIGTFSAALFLPWAFKWARAPLIDLIASTAGVVAAPGSSAVPR